MPGQLSSPVCLTVIWFLSWSLCPLCRAHILTNEGVQYGRLGSNVTLACGTSSQRAAVQWHLSHTLSLPSHSVTSDGALVLHRVDQSVQGNYSCYDDQGNLLHSVKLRLGNPPGKLNISCRLPNHSLVRCSWLESVKTFLPAQYHAFYRGKGEEWKPCVVDPSLERCEITLPTYWQPVHILNITVTNALGREQTFTQIRMDKLLKPDPPESVTVEGQVGHPTRLLVAWRYPSTWPVHSAFPLMFQIRYRPQGSTHWSEIESEDIPVLISDALAGYPHQVQVRAQDEVNSDSQWSEWSPLVLAWPWGAYNTPEPALETLLPEEDFFAENFPVDINPETSTAKTQNSTLDEDGNIGLVILLVLFSVVILTTVLSLILVMWMKQRRRDHVTKQELTSMVKMKSMPI